MMHKIGIIIAGKYEKFEVWDKGNILTIENSDYSDTRRILFQKTDITWSLFQAEDTTSTSYSFWKGMAGAVLFGPFGLIAGTGGKKTGKKTYLIEVIWNDTQERSLLELDEKGYKTFLRYMY